MDQELKHYLDQGFSRIDARFERMEGRLDGMDARFERMEDRLNGMDERLSGVESHLSGMDERLSGVEGRLSGVEDTVHQALVLIEGQRDDLRQVAEGVMGVNQRLDAFRTEVNLRFEHVQSMIASPYSELSSRVKVLESWKESIDRDPARKRFGRPKTT